VSPIPPPSQLPHPPAPAALADLLDRGAHWLRENFSIRWRLALWSGTLLSAILLLLSIVTYTIAANQLETSVQLTIKGRAQAIATALQHEQYASPPVVPTPAPTPTLQTTPSPSLGTPTPVSTPDPATSAAIQKQLSVTVPEVLGQLDLGFEVLDSKGQPKYVAATLGGNGLPLDVGLINAVLRGAPGASYTTQTRSSLLAIYVQPLVFQPRTTGANVPDSSANAAAASGITHKGRAAPQIVGVVLVAKSVDDVNRALTTLRQVLLLGDIVALALALSGGWFIAKRGLRPVATVTRAARAIAINAHAAGLGTRVIYSGPRDEVGELVTTFNDMLAALERVSDAQRRFVQDASHEMRAPLTSIKGNLDFLQRAANLPTEERDALMDASSEAARLATLVNDLLLLARVDASARGGYGLREAWLDEQLRGRREPIALDEVVMEAFRQCRGQLEARRKDLRLSVSELEPMTVRGDPGQIRQLVHILLDNAIKYTPSGGKVRLAVTHAEGRAELTVADTGIGIAPEDMPHIFERFYRADQARVRDEQGSGLGLAIAQWIVQAHDGTLDVRSTPAQGSTFSVRLKAERRVDERTQPRVPAVRRADRSGGLLGGAMQPLARFAGSVSKPRRSPQRENREFHAARSVPRTADSAEPSKDGGGGAGRHGKDIAPPSARHRRPKAASARVERDKRRARDARESRDAAASGDTAQARE
jgi:signal transduction histidine kinase